MKLIIDIPEWLYQDIQEYLHPSPLDKVIQNGILLDDIKTEIAEEICLTDNPYTKETKYTIEHLKLLEILDSVGKAESEDT